MARSVNLPPDQKVNRRKSSDRAKSHKVLLPPPLHGRPPHASSPRLTFSNGYVGGDHPAQVKNTKRWPSQGTTFLFPVVFKCGPCHNQLKHQRLQFFQLFTQGHFNSSTGLRLRQPAGELRVEKIRQGGKQETSSLDRKSVV